MGAWGHGLFENDKDYDIISELDHEIGLPELEKQTNNAEASDAKEQKGDDGVHYSIFANLCDDVEKVRNYLDTGKLATLLSKYEIDMLLLNAKEYEFYREADYIFMLICACAMTLGCTIPERYKRTMQKIYMCTGFGKYGVKQFAAALSGPGAYVDGEPHAFDYPTRAEDEAREDAALNNAKPNSMGFIGMNVHGPGTMFFNPGPVSMKGMKELKVEFAEGHLHGEGLCGCCGSSAGQDGSALLTCGKCKSCKYCGKECQTKHWKVHKKVCKATGE